MKDYDTEEKLLEYFRKINCTGKDNCCFTCSNMTQTSFGIVGALLSIKKNKNIMGYLLNKTEEGICLIPIVAVSMNKNEIKLDEYIFIKNEEIEKVKISNEEIGFKKIKIELKDKTKFVLKVSKKIINIDYHKKNLDRFIEMYK